MDAACAATYKINRRGGNWDKLMNNLAFIAGLRAAETVKYVRLDMIVQDNNYHEAKGFIEIARRFGFHCVLQRLLNLGSFSEAEYGEKNVVAADHPQHADFLAAMRSLPAYDRLEPGNLIEFTDRGIPAQEATQ